MTKNVLILKRIEVLDCEQLPSPVNKGFCVLDINNINVTLYKLRIFIIQMFRTRTKRAISSFLN